MAKFLGIRKAEVQLRRITPPRIRVKKPAHILAQLGIYDQLHFAFQRTAVSWKASSESFARSVPLQYYSPAQR
jgi:hypothetical protein